MIFLILDNKNIDGWLKILNIIEFHNVDMYYDLD